jgi:S1-C subfamily serine protease
MYIHLPTAVRPPPHRPRLIRGAGVVAVTRGGPAATAGIGRGDISTAVNGTAVPDAPTLSQVLAPLRPGQRARVKMGRPGGGSDTVSVTLGQLPGR